jgi:ADP-ribosylglycohydrolase
MVFHVCLSIPWLPRIKPAWLNNRFSTLSQDQALDRAQGALPGLAIGDAVGTTLEFQRRGQGHVYDRVGGGPFRLAPGEWTDDTSMTLCLADTYASQGKFDFATFADAMVRGYRQGENRVNGRCFDIGNVTRAALEGWEAQGPDWMGNIKASTAGNGIVDTPMAPLPNSSSKKSHDRSKKLKRIAGRLRATLCASVAGALPAVAAADGLHLAA